MVGHIVHAVYPDKKAGEQVRTASAAARPGAPRRSRSGIFAPESQGARRRAPSKFLEVLEEYLAKSGAGKKEMLV